MIIEKFDISTEDSKSFPSSDSGYGYMVSSDEDNNCMMQANDEAVKFLERMWSWSGSIQSFEQLMQPRIEDELKNREETVDDEFETRQNFGEP